MITSKKYVMSVQYCYYYSKYAILNLRPKLFKIRIKLLNKLQLVADTGIRLRACWVYLYNVIVFIKENTRRLRHKQSKVV